MIMHPKDPQDDDDPQVVSIFVAASDFAVSALESMIQRNATNPGMLERIKRRYVDLAFGLELEFVFPGLTGEERDALAGLQKAKNALSVQFGGLRQWRTEPDRDSHTEVTRNLKVEFLRQKTRIERLELEKHLDPLQLKILKHQFLSVPPDKSESTSFIHRRERTSTTPLDNSDRTPATAAGAECAAKNKDRHIPMEAPRPHETSQNVVMSTAEDSGTQRRLPARSLDQTDRRLLFVAAQLHEYQDALSELAETGFHVQFTPDLKSALESVIDSPPDLVVLDLALPARDEVNREVSGASRFMKGLGLVNDRGVPPIIGLCDESSMEILNEADLASAITTTLRKPVTGRRLLSATCIALDDTFLESASDRSIQSGAAVVA